MPTQCKCRTKLKIRCKRAAKSGSDYCTQHTKIGCSNIYSNTNTNTKKNNVQTLTLQNQKNQTSGKLYRMTATVKLDSELTDRRPTPPVSARELYQYLISDGGKRIKGLVEHLSMYQYRYNTKAHTLQVIGNECVLSFILSVKDDASHMDRHYRNDSGRRRLQPMLKFIQEDLAGTARDLGDSCYESLANDDECHYPFPDGSVSEIKITNVKLKAAF